jgi:hypothetical protein
VLAAAAFAGGAYAATQEPAPGVPRALFDEVSERVTLVPGPDGAAAVLVAPALPQAPQGAP